MGHLRERIYWNVGLGLLTLMFVACLTVASRTTDSSSARADEQQIAGRAGIGVGDFHVATRAGIGVGDFHVATRSGIGVSHFHVATRSGIGVSHFHVATRAGEGPV